MGGELFGATQTPPHVYSIAEYDPSGTTTPRFNYATGRGDGQIAAYVRYGLRVSRDFGHGVASPNSLSCSADRLVYVADDAGLFRFSEFGGVKPFSPGAFGRLTAPIYGVLAK